MPRAVIYGLLVEGEFDRIYRQNGSTVNGPIVVTASGATTIEWLHHHRKPITIYNEMRWDPLGDSLTAW